MESEISGEGHGACEPEVETARSDHFPDAFRSAFFEVEGHVGVLSTVFGEEASKKVTGGRADVSDTEFAFFALGCASDRFECGVMLIEESTGFAEEGGAGFGEANAFAVAVEEDGAERFLHFFDGSAEGGLGDPKSGSCFGKAEFFGDGEEVSELP